MDGIGGKREREGGSKIHGREREVLGGGEGERKPQTDLLVKDV